MTQPGKSITRKRESKPGLLLWRQRPYQWANGAVFRKEVMLLKSSEMLNCYLVLIRT